MMKSFVLSLLLFPLLAIGQPIKTSFEKSGRNYTMSRGGQPYFIKGAVGSSHLELLKKFGGNSIRTYDSENAKAILDKAKENGLSVTLGLWFPFPEDGFDYSNPDSRANLMEDLTKVILAHKDHPALLMWALGNELNYGTTENEALWSTINDVAKMIHLLDKNHPTIMPFAGVNKDEIKTLLKLAPEVDAIGINAYGSLDGIASALRTYGWKKPYIFTEWGPNAHWSAPKTHWGSLLEQSSTQKAESYRSRYNNGILADPKLCMGSYVYLWGNKTEQTKTWYSLFDEQSNKSGAVAELHVLWTGNRAGNRPPEIEALKIAGKSAMENIILGLESQFTALAQATDPDGDNLTFEWIFTTDKQNDTEQNELKVFDDLIVENKGNGISFNVPNVTGAYRLYVYVFDNRGNFATSNIPFFVN